jgi:1-acyl-sn-glycerol-3-phosphate acyltransferase
LSQSSPRAKSPARSQGLAPGEPTLASRIKRAYIRFCLRLWIGWYLRVRATGLNQLPPPPYLLNFSHPNWIDPFLVTAFLPAKPRIFIFGPKEERIKVGWRNRLIGWSEIAVPFKPSKSDLIDTTRRAMRVLSRGDVLAIAGEGRLSDREGAIVPLEEGPAFLALRGKVPIVPMAIIGTRWLRFGKVVELRIGPPLTLDGRRADRAGIASLTAQLQSAMEELLVGVEEEPPPGPFGRWLTDVFNERPWLTAVSAESGSAPGAPEHPG